MYTLANFKMESSVELVLTNGKMEVFTKVSLWKARDKEKDFGKAIMEIYLKVSISKISKMVGANLHGQTDRSMKGSLEMTSVTVRVLTDIQMAR